MVKSKVITYHHVTDLEHPVISLKKHPKIPEVLRKTCRDLGLEPYACTHAVIAYCGGKAVGTFRYALTGNSLEAKGTAVIPSMRRKGIAYKLWERALTKIYPTEVVVATESDEGESLVVKLSKDYTICVWHIY